MHRYILAIALILISCGSVFLIVHYDTLLDKPAQPASSSKPTMVIQNITLKEKEKKNGYDLIIKAQEGSFNHITDQVMCHNVLCTLVNKKTTMAQLFAPDSQVDRRNKIMTLDGPVKGFLKELAFQGKDLTYNYSTQILTTSHSVTYTHPNFTLTAEQSNISVRQQKMEMKNVWSQFYLLSPERPKTYNARG